MCLIGTNEMHNKQCGEILATGLGDEDIDRRVGAQSSATKDCEVGETSTIAHQLVVLTLFVCSASPTINVDVNAQRNRVLAT
jgi:hypothetical protein